ncbi:hypothetical protein B0H14DRAFT_3534548 [Mycena olivaceomarginata]|nr:hypothetical protein B0H14DRAFT_3534548 [Mycena olivaceomarginata]
MTLQDKALTQSILPGTFSSLPIAWICLVGYKNGTRDLTGLTSRSTYDGATLLSNTIGYIPSYKKPKAGPKLLDDEEARDVLIVDKVVGGLRPPPHSEN